MSFEAAAIALHHSQATGSAKLVLIGIANHDGDGGSWAGMQTLARYGGVTLRNAQKAVDRLVQLSEVSVDISAGGTARTADHARPNLYHFLLKCPDNCDGTTQHRILCMVCRKPVPEVRRRHGHHAKCDPLSLATPPVASDTSPLSLATPEPSINRSTTRTSLESQVGNRASDTHVAVDYCPTSSKHTHRLDAEGRCGYCGIDTRVAYYDRTSNEVVYYEEQR